MPNLMMDALKSFVSSTNATTTLAEIKSDAETIKDTFMSGARTAQEKYREMRGNGGFKKLTDWFFQKGDDFGLGSTLEDSDDDEFDAGFQFDDGSNEDQPTSKVLDYDAMKGIAKGQVSAMYQIGGKQAEASAMTTSEIIATVNTRSSEILSSLGSINSSLTSISGKLDKLIELSTVSATSNRNKQQGLLDGSGNLTLGSLFGYAKDRVTNEVSMYTGIAKSMVDMLRMQASMGMLSPGELIGSGAGMLLGNKKIKALDNRSLNDVGTDIDEFVKNVQNRALTKLLDTDIFQKFFGNLTKKTANTDYSQYVQNQYTTDKALFDGMTRKSIIDVIPGYLRKITEALTGTTYHVSEYGTLTTEKPKNFQQVFRSTIRDGMRNETINSIYNNRTAGSSINKNDIRTAQRVMMSLYTQYASEKGLNIIDPDLLISDSKDIRDRNEAAINLLAQFTDKPASYWSECIAAIMLEFENSWTARNSFARQITSTSNAAHGRAKRYAETATITDDIGSFTQEMAEDLIKEYLTAYSSTGGDDRTYRELVRDHVINKSDVPADVDPDSRPSDEFIKKKKLDQLKQSEVVGGISASFKEASTKTVDYLSSIFDLLNRGINVYTVRRKKKFPKMSLRKASDASHTTVVDPDPVEEAPVTDGTPAAANNGSNIAPDPNAGQPDGEEGDGQQNPDDTGQQNLTHKMSTGDRIAAGLKTGASAFMLSMNPMKFVETIKIAASNELNAIQSDLTNAASYVADNVGAKVDMRLNKDQKLAEIASMKQEVGSMEATDEVSQKDQQIANEALASMQAAVADGDTSADTAALLTHISNIQDPELKGRMTSLVEGTLKRSGTKKPAQSKIGRILLWAWAGVKKFISPILTKAKTFISKIGSKLINVIVDSLKSSGQMIVRGAKNVKEGIFGVREKKDKDGNVIREGQDGLIQNVRDIRNNLTSAWDRGDIQRSVKRKVRDVSEDVAGKAVDIAENVGIWGGAVKQTITDNINERRAAKGKGTIQEEWEANRAKLQESWDETKAKWTARGEQWKEIGQNISSAASNYAEVAKDKLSPVVDKAKSIGGKVAEVGGKIGDKLETGFVNAAGTALGNLQIAKNSFLESDFGKGFMESFKKEEKNKEPKAETLADVATSTIRDILKTEDGVVDGKKTILSVILGKLEDIRKVFAGDVEENNQTEEGGSGEENAPETDTKTDETSKVVENESDKTDAVTDTNASGGSPEATTPSTAELGTGSEGGGENTGGTKSAAPKADTSTASTATAGGESGGKKGGLGFNLGKTLGGLTSILGGIGKAVLTVIMSMEGFKALMNIGTDILKKSLAPLNKAFQSMYKALKPVVNAVQKLLKQIVEYVVEIVQTVIEVIQPIIEAILPIIETIMDTLSPILEMVTGLVKVIMVPLMAIMKVVVVPVLRGISNTLEIILGVVQVGMGIIMTALGGLLVGIGMITKFLTGNDSIKETGSQMFNMGTSLTKSGAQSVVSGMKKNLTLVGDTIGDVISDIKGENKDEKETPSKAQKIDTTLNGSPMDGLYGSGDSSVVMDVYGGDGANQRRYGNYLNMGNRGCGPVALADAYSRRTGRNINAMQVASAMSSAGTYNAQAGTSVRGYINSSRALGMNLTPGGVTPASLRRATPNNPITVIGSGTDYTTRRGNNHYMNVIGSDANGHAYVSNPMTGRVERKSISSLAANSVLGLYGSGDENAPYRFSDEVQDALGTLKSIVGNLVEMFTGSNSIEDQLDEETTNAEYEQKQIDASNMSEEEQSAIDARARELFEKSVGRYEGETDAEFEARYQANKKKYWAMAATEKIREKVKATADGTDEGAMSLINETLGDGTDENKGFIGNFSQSMFDAADRVEAGGLANLLNSSGTSGGTAAGFYSDRGAKLWTDQYTPTVFQNDATGWTLAGPNTDYKLILAEFFQKTMSPQLRLSGAFRKYLPPASADAEGSMGDEHSGADFTIGGNPEVHATTGGTVLSASENDDRYGSYIEIIDSGGDHHIYGHLQGAAKYKSGDKIEGGDVIGNMGKTGTDGEHLHYEIRDTNNTILNPFTFFKYVAATSGGSSSYGSITLDPQDAMIRAAAETFVAARNTLGSDLKWNGTNVTNIRFDDGFTIDKIAPTHCTSMMAGVVKRMGYYTNSKGKPYTDTYQGDDQMIGAASWGVDGSNGNPKIYNKDGTISTDWTMGPASDGWKPGDIMFTSLGNAHAHMPVFSIDEGQVLGFNGGRDDSLSNSVKLGEYYLANGTTPPSSTKMNWLDKYTDSRWSDQIGAQAGPLSYYIRYVGPPVTFGSTTTSIDGVYTSPDYGTVSDVGAAQNAYESQKASEDKTSGVPYYYLRGKTPGYSTVTNKAGTELFSVWDITNQNSNAVSAFQKAHARTISYIKYDGSKVLAYDWRTTTAGTNAYNYVKTNHEKYSKTWGTGNSSSNNGSVISTKTSRADLNTITYDLYNGAYTKSYISNLSESKLIDMINRAYDRSGNAVYYDSTSGNVYYKNGGNGNKIYVKSNGSVYYPDLVTQTNNGTNVVNPGSNSSTTTTTTASKTYPTTGDIMNSVNNWNASRDYWSTHGSGDESPIMSPDIPTFDVSDIMPYSDIGPQPVIVNRYETVTDQDSAISRLNAVLSNTYNVRSEKIEGILEDMLALMKEKNQQRRQRQLTGSTTSSSSGNKSAFSSEDIPRQVERLAVG